MDEMKMQFKLREPKIGMQIVSKGDKCCFGMPKGDVGTIVEIEPNGLEFTVTNWYGKRESHCVQCALELREVTKKTWLEMCDEEAKRGARK